MKIVSFNIILLPLMNIFIHKLPWIEAYLDWLLTVASLPGDRQARKLFMPWTAAWRWMRISAYFCYQPKSWQISFVARWTHEKVTLAFFENSWFLIHKILKMTTLDVVFLFDLLRVMGWRKQKDISEICLLLFLCFVLSFNKFWSVVGMRIKLFKDLLHGALLRQKGMFLRFWLQGKVL